MSDPASPSMRRTAIWSTLGLAAAQISRIVIALLLARILGPDSFAPIAAGAVFMTFVSLSVDLGLVSAVIQRPVLTEAHLSVAALMSWIVGGTFTLLTLAASFSGLAGPIGSPMMLTFAVLGFAPLIRAIGLASQSWLYRERQQHLIGMAEAGMAVIALASCVVSAALGLGVFAYVIPVMTTEVVLTVMWIVLRRGFPWPRWHRDSFRDLWSVGAKTFGSDALAVATRNMDSIIVGSLAGAAQLSLYSVGVRFLITPVQFLDWAIVRVALPDFAQKHRTGTDLRPTLAARTRQLSLTVWPALTAGFFAAPWAVTFVLGPTWQPAVVLTQALCIGAALQVSLTFLRPALIAVGAAKQYLYFSLTAFALSAVAYVAGARFGGLGVAVGYVMVWVVCAPALAVLAARVTGLPARVLVSSVYIGVPAAALIVAAVLAFGLVTNTAGNRLAEAIVATAVAIVCLGLLHSRRFTRTRTPVSVPGPSV